MTGSIRPPAGPLAAVRKKARARTHAQMARAQRYVKSRLVWHLAYRAMSYVRSALWVIPFFAVLAILLFAPILRALDARFDFDIVGLGLSGAQALFQTVITLTLSFLVFTFGSLLVAIQIAGGQLTPRIIATTLLRDNVVRYSVGLFVFALAFAVTSQNRLEDRVPELVVLLNIVLGVVSMAVFLFLIDYAARLLRPVSVVARVGEEGLKVIKVVYPLQLEPGEDDTSGSTPALGEPERILQHPGNSEIILAVDLETLVEEARGLGGLIELVPQVGDFVANEEPLFALYGGASRIDDRKLLSSVAFGVERTIEQDPIFAFRILVDIGLKALSPAINDPTTGVLALDQIHRLLRVVGRRYLHGEVVEDGAGEPRMIYRTPNWDDFVHVSCQEIRSCGGSNVQIARRMRAMLEDLIGSLPATRHASLLAQLELLDRAVGTQFAFEEDRALAMVADPQGLGGSSRAARQRARAAD